MGDDDTVVTSQIYKNKSWKSPFLTLCLSFRGVQLPDGGHDLQASDRLLPLHHLLPHRHHRLLLMDVVLARPQVGE